MIDVDDDELFRTEIKKIGTELSKLINKTMILIIFIVVPIINKGNYK